MKTPTIKKLLCIFIVVMLLTGMLAACSSSSVSNEENEAQSNENDIVLGKNENDSADSQTTISASERLLGKNNLFDQMDEAYFLDGQSYEYKITDMVYTLIDAFENTAKLGTHAVQVAVKALIPEAVYKDKADTEEKIDAIYTYLQREKLCRYFTISYAGGIPTDAYIDIDNVFNFVEDAIAAGTATGTVNLYEFDENITSLSEFAQKMGITREVAFGILNTIDDYNADRAVGDTKCTLDQFTE